MDDPYLYPGTDTLINCYDIKNQEQLQELEAVLFLIKSTEPLPTGDFDYVHLKALHQHLFGDIYPWAGKERSVNISKANSLFAHNAYIKKEADKLFLNLKNDKYLRNLQKPEFCKKLSEFFNTLNAIHPFREGNGRVQRIFCQILAQNAGFELDWSLVSTKEYLEASISGFMHGDDTKMESIFAAITKEPLQKKIDGERILLSEESKKMIQEYVKIQVELSEAIKNRDQFSFSNPVMSQEHQDKIISLNQDADILSENFLSKEDVKKFVLQPHAVLLSIEDNFKKILTRMQQGSATEKDLLFAIRQARSKSRSNPDLKQSIFKKSNSREK